MRLFRFAFASFVISSTPACSVANEQFDGITQQAYIKASNAETQDTFGRSIALSADGSTLAVGAFRENSAATGINQDEARNDAREAGAVYVFVRNGTTWSQQAYIKASNTESDDWFGTSLALSADGSTLAVGAPGEDSRATGIGGDQADNSAEFAGAVYVFARTAATWTQQAYVKPSNTAALDKFGSSVSLSADGSILAIGAPGSMGSTGAAYMFARKSGAWSQEDYLTAPDSASPGSFGSSTALSADGSILAVGAPCEDLAAGSAAVTQPIVLCGIPLGDPSPGGPALAAGSVYVFARTGTMWTPQAHVAASNAGQGDNFGAHLALSADGSTLAVGAPSESSAATGVDGDSSDDSAGSAGAVYVFSRSGTAWPQQTYVKASNAEAGDFFGAGVALSADGSSLLVGAPAEDGPANGINGPQRDATETKFSGAVYVFRRSGATWRQRAYVKASNTGMDDHFGSDVALSSDDSIIAVGADGEASVARGVNVDQNDDDAPNAGAAYVFLSQPRDPASPYTADSGASRIDAVDPVARRRRAGADSRWR